MLTRLLVVLLLALPASVEAQEPSTREEASRPEATEGDDDDSASGDDDDSAKAARASAIELQLTEMQGEVTALQMELDTLRPPEPGAAVAPELSFVGSAEVLSTNTEYDPGDLERRQVEGIRVAVERVKYLKSQIVSLERSLAGEENPDELQDLQTRIDAIYEEMDVRRKELIQLSTGLDLDVIDNPDHGAQTLEDEARELLSPLLHEVRAATERPRQIESLNAELDRLGSTLSRLAGAVHHLDERLDQTSDERIRKELQSSRRYLMRRLGATQGAMDLVKSQLAALHGTAGKGLVDSAERVMQVFFARRGRNLLWALGSVLLVILVGRLLRRLSLRLIRAGGGGDSTLSRVVELLIYITTLLLAVFAIAAVLYASGDWVLLTLFSIALVGAFWGARAGLADAWAEVRLLLNVGPVRDGERVVIDGVPWRVQSLHLVCLFENPEFPGTVLRFPLSALVDMHSRPYREDEPWFPTRPGDFVLFDGLPAEIIQQSPDFVTVKRNASAHNVPTGDFVGMSVTNLSSGFRHRVVLTLDYQHQAIVTKEVPAAVRDAVAAAIATHSAGEFLTQLGADFDGARDSSLDVEVEADFTGEAAPWWEELNEVIHSAVVDCCTEQGWVIAFPQLTVHQAS
ncbi:MAG: hypothetical protein KDA24_11310 [Deltaproteobacteria bacterium]|nr:hypothetical protein [Deltaproteobacteria bacterium]